jgi:sugar fermentation stimulation protein A
LFLLFLAFCPVEAEISKRFQNFPNFYSKGCGWMEFPVELVHGRLIKRYKRFLADILMPDGTEITAHCANSGSMMGLKEEGYGVWLSKSDNPKRKLKYSWELVDTGEALVGINTSHPNKIVAEAIKTGKVPELVGYDILRTEVKYGENSRIDILLQDDNKADCYVEVKNVTLSREAGLVEFPDSVTSRGTKHLRELANMVASGHRATMFYLVQRTDADRFKLASDLDPTYAAAFAEARAGGVEILCYDCYISPEKIEIRDPIQLVE